MKKVQLYLNAEEVVDTKFYKSQKKKFKKDKCLHKFWTCKCSICGAVLGSDSNLDFLTNNK